MNSINLSKIQIKTLRSAFKNNVSFYNLLCYDDVILIYLRHFFYAQGSPLFAIRQKIVSPEMTEGTIFLLGPLDFEMQSMYHLTLLASVSNKYNQLLLLIFSFSKQRDHRINSLIIC
jgi:hypothetical protein